MWARNVLGGRTVGVATAAAAAGSSRAGARRTRSTGSLGRSAVSHMSRAQLQRSSIAPGGPVGAGQQARERSTSQPGARKGFQAEQDGLGSAVVHSAYDQLGADVPVPTFLDVPKTVRVVGAPMSWGQPRAGTDHGAQILRDHGLEDTLINLEWRLDDRGDLTFDPPQRNDPVPDRSKVDGLAKNCFCVGSGLKKIHDEVYDAAQLGEFALTLGGDHSVSAGSVSAILRARPDTGIIWVDAHGDLNIPEAGGSGNMHGMPVGLMMKRMDPTLLPGFEWMADVPELKPEQIVFVGLRDLDPPERQFIREQGIKAYTMSHIDHFGIGQVMDMAIEDLRKEDGTMRPLHLSYDIDAVDPQYAPSTGTVVRGGLSLREALYASEAASNTGMLGSMDLVEVNPKLTAGPESAMTASLGMALIGSAMGSRIL